ncbi:MAG: CbiX/SirB N-terminal domain-containing protein [Thiohalobacteraceae bacterium]
MKALLLVAHGSRRAASNDEVRELTARLAVRAQPAIPIVRCGFLELAEPSIPDGIEQCIREGATAVVVLPYFLSAGRHVVTDIPAAVAGKQAQYPQADIRIAPYLGASIGITDLLLDAAGLDPDLDPGRPVPTTADRR